MYLWKSYTKGQKPSLPLHLHSPPDFGGVREFAREDFHSTMNSVRKLPGDVKFGVFLCSA